MLKLLARLFGRRAGPRTRVKGVGFYAYGPEADRIEVSFFRGEAGTPDEAYTNNYQQLTAASARRVQRVLQGGRAKWTPDGRGRVYQGFPQRRSARAGRK